MGFGPSTIWALPAGYGSYQPLDEPLYQSTNCYSNTDPTYATLDIDGDLKPDLVVSRRCSDPDVGKTKWLVYENSP